MRPILLAAAMTIALAQLSGCASTSSTSTSASQAASQTRSLDAAIAGTWRSAENAARDQYRHPRETLQFFGVRDNDAVIEITPGAGWYSEILGPYLRDRGSYLAFVADPATASSAAARDRSQASKAALENKFSARADVYGKAQVMVFDPKQPVFGPAQTADAILTFRNVHNWVAAGNAQAYFDAFYAALKPGGVLGVVDHRAKPGTDIDTMKKSGYLTEALVIEYATKAGFVLDAQSEINANPKDTADHPDGVWTLPPTNRHDAADDAKYRAIGESDRMTLRFRKRAR